MEISIARVNVSNNEIKFKLHLPRPLRKYFLNDSLYVQYDSSLDLGSVDSSILAIPVMSVVAPIAWAVGADVHLGELDTTYLQSLRRIKEIYRGLFPTFSFSGDIRAEREVANQFGGNRTGMLFSGGVDSLTSYLRHKIEEPDLISVWGVLDIPPSEEQFWNRMWTDISSLADSDGVRAFQIKTDLIRNINHELLSREFQVWWYGVAARPFLLGMCPPMTANRGIGTIIIASSYTEDYKVSSASHPSIDNNVSWADVRVVQDGFELSRQQKVRYLCQTENARYLSHLRVCWGSAVRMKCGECEKCLRTITNLAVEGIDPNDCNFDVDTETFLRLKDSFIRGRIRLNTSQMFMWRDIQRSIPERIDTDIGGSREFLEWLREYDLSKHNPRRLHSRLWEAHRLHRNGRVKAPAVRRKIRCYFYILLSKLKII